MFERSDVAGIVACDHRTICRFCFVKKYDHIYVATRRDRVDQLVVVNGQSCLLENLAGSRFPGIFAVFDEATGKAPVTGVWFELSLHQNQSAFEWHERSRHGLWVIPVDELALHVDAHQPIASADFTIRQFISANRAAVQFAISIKHWF